MGAIPFLFHKKRHPVGVPFLMEQGTGVEPAFTAWEAVVLPIYEPCVCGYYSKAGGRIQPLFVGDKITYKQAAMAYTVNIERK